jgi:hypothetical protein
VQFHCEDPERLMLPESLQNLFEFIGDHS